MILTPLNEVVNFPNELMVTRLTALIAVVSSGIAIKRASRWWVVALIGSIVMLILGIVELS
jgi:hypothetical protein